MGGICHMATFWQTKMKLLTCSTPVVGLAPYVWFYNSDRLSNAQVAWTGKHVALSPSTFKWHTAAAVQHSPTPPHALSTVHVINHSQQYNIHLAVHEFWWDLTLWWNLVNLFPLIPACTARPGLPLSPPETAFLESPYYRPQTASIADRHHPTNFHSVTYTQNDDAAFEAGSDNDHKSFLRMRVIFTVEYPAELFRFRRVLDDILSSFDVF